MFRKLFYLSFLIFFSLVFLSGCASRREIVRFKQQLDYLEESNRRQEENLTQLDSLLRVQIDQSQRLRADINSSMGWMDERLKVVEGKLDESGYKVSELSKKMDSVKQQIIEADTLKMKDTTASKVNVDSEKLYDGAYLNVIKGNYELAILGFSDYLKYFPKSQSASDAQYWIGECYYSLKNQTKAIEEFEKLLSDYPSSDKIPTALFKIGLIYLDLKDKTKANKYLRQLVDKYPNSQEAKLAKERLGIKK